MAGPGHVGCGDGHAGAGVGRRHLRGFWEESTGRDRSLQTAAFRARWPCGQHARVLRASTRCPRTGWGPRLRAPQVPPLLGSGGLGRPAQAPAVRLPRVWWVACAPGANHPASPPPLGVAATIWHLALGWWAGCDGGAPGGGPGPPGFPWGPLLSTRLPPLLPQGGPGKGGPTCQSAGVLASQAPRGWVL